MQITKDYNVIMCDDAIAEVASIAESNGMSFEISPYDEVTDHMTEILISKGPVSMKVKATWNISVEVFYKRIIAAFKRFAVSCESASVKKRRLKDVVV